MSSYDFHKEEDLESFCRLRLRHYSSRSLDLMLLEMRKLDRDRQTCERCLTMFGMEWNGMNYLEKAPSRCHLLVFLLVESVCKFISANSCFLLSISNILKHHSHVWDREKILHPATVESLLHKYNVPLSPCVDPLLDRFEHEELPGLVNYETMLQWLHTQRQLGQVSQAPDPG